MIEHHIVEIGATPEGLSAILDVDALIGSHLCAVANSGGGKSGLLRKILEETHGHIQQIVLDPEDDFYTLREIGPYVIAGGDGADIPISLTGAGELARKTLEAGFSLIVQLNDLGADAPLFVADFVHALMNSPRALWHPVLIVVDETQRFAPSQGSTEATDAIRDIVQRGRKRGFTGLFASLAISSIDPRVRGLCNNWLLGRTGSALDRDTAANQLGFTRAMTRDGAMKLEKREFWGYGPAIADEPMKFRVSDFTTTHVHSGQAKVSTPPAPKELTKILAELAKALAPKRPATTTIPVMEPGAEIAATDQRVAQLAVELAAASSALAAGQEEYDKLRYDLRMALKRAAGDLNVALSAIERAIAYYPGWEDEDLGAEPPTSPIDIEFASKPTSIKLADIESTPGVNHAPDPAKDLIALPGQRAIVDGDTEAPTGRALEVLQVLVDSKPVGGRWLTEKAWAMRCRVDRKSSTWRGYKAKLRGWFSQENGRVSATRAANGLFPVHSKPLTGRALVQSFMADLPTGAGEVLKVLAGVYPNSIDRKALADAVGTEASKSTFRGYLAPLSKLELIERQGELIRLADELMQED